MIISFFAIILANSDSAYLGLLILFAFLPLFTFGYWQGIKRYVLVLTTFFTVTQIIDIICQYMGDKVLWINSLYSVIINFSKLSWIVLGCWLLTALFYIINFYNKKTIADKRFLKTWLGIIIVCLLYTSYPVSRTPRPIPRRTFPLSCWNTTMEPI